eukprot:364185-Chlamydomonas_euryale.AAC.8
MPQVPLTSHDVSPTAQHALLHAADIHTCVHAAARCRHSTKPHRPPPCPAPARSPTSPTHAPPAAAAIVRPRHYDRALNRCIRPERTSAPPCPIQVTPRPLTNALTACWTRSAAPRRWGRSRRCTGSPGRRSRAAWPPTGTPPPAGIQSRRAPRPPTSRRAPRRWQRWHAAGRPPAPWQRQALLLLLLGVGLSQVGHLRGDGLELVASTELVSSRCCGRCLASGYVINDLLEAVCEKQGQGCVQEPRPARWRWRLFVVLALSVMLLFGAGNST